MKILILFICIISFLLSGCEKEEPLKEIKLKGRGLTNWIAEATITIENQTEEYSEITVRYYYNGKRIDFYNDDSVSFTFAPSSGMILDFTYSKEKGALGDYDIKQIDERTFDVTYPLVKKLDSKQLILVSVNNDTFKLIPVE